MDDGYRAIEWKAIFLIAGMWPLGTALVSTGLADVAANGLLSVARGMPSIALAAILLLIAGVLSQVIGGQVAVPILLAPIAVAIGHETGADPRGLAMAVALGSSLGFLTPVGHPVNTLVMGPGGYATRFPPGRRLAAADPRAAHPGRPSSVLELVTHDAFHL